MQRQRGETQEERRRKRDGEKATKWKRARTETENKRYKGGKKEVKRKTGEI
jgi:hypothetical protein